MELTMGETDPEHLRPRREANLVTKTTPSRALKGNLQTPKRRTATSVSLRKRGKLWNRTILATGVATILILAAGITVAILQNKGRMRSRISSEVPSGRMAAHAVSKQAMTSLGSHCVAVFAAQKARFLTKQGHEGGGHTMRDGQALRKLAEGGGPGKRGRLGSSAEELQCVVSREVLAFLTRTPHLGAAPLLELPDPPPPRLPLGVTLNRPRFPTVPEVITFLATNTHQTEEAVLFELAEILKRHSDRTVSELYHIFFECDFNTEKVREFLNSAPRGPSVAHRELLRCSEWTAGFAGIDAAVQHSLLQRLGLTGVYPAPVVKPNVLLGDPSETLDTAEGAGSLFRAMSLVLTGTVDHAFTISLRLAEWMSQNYLSDDDARAHLSPSTLQMLEAKERAARFGQQADAGVPHREEPVKRLRRKYLLSARVHRMKTAALEPHTSMFDLKALADMLQVSFYVYAVPRYDKYSGLMQLGGWTVIHPELPPTKSVSRRQKPVIYLTAGPSEGEFSLVTAVGSPFWHSIQREQLLALAAGTRKARAESSEAVTSTSPTGGGSAPEPEFEDTYL